MKIKKLSSQQNTVLVEILKSLNNPNLYWTLNNMTLENKNIIVDKINLNGRIEKLELRNNLNIDSNLLILKSDFLADFNQKKPK